MDICVIGGGFIGLCTGLRLLECGHSVTLKTLNTVYHRTSEYSAAFWYPYAISFVSQNDEKKLAFPTYEFLANACKTPETSGVFLCTSRQYFDDSANRDHYRMPWWKKIRGVTFRKLPRIDLPEASALLGRFVEGWEFKIPVLNPAVFLGWLEKQFQIKGGVHENDDVTNLFSNKLKKKYRYTINCTGGWASRVTDDDRLFGLKGVLVRVPQSVYRPKNLTFIEHGRSENAPVYMVPHYSGDTILGGTLLEVTNQGEKWSKGNHSLWEADIRDARDILQRCALVDPSINAFINNVEEFQRTAGLRPRRHNRPPRIEVDKNSSNQYTVIHNYGHGGSGATLCWGSALYVEEIIKKCENEYMRPALTT
jgi:D-amino-acid oxidase